MVEPNATHIEKSPRAKLTARQAAMSFEEVERRRSHPRKYTNATTIVRMSETGNDPNTP
jgi:hypothetical protein